MMKPGRLGTILWLCSLFSPLPSSAEVYQWVDARGVIHLTDNLDSLPDSMRGSSGLIVRRDLDRPGTSPVTFDQAENVPVEPPAPPTVPELDRPPEGGEKPAPPPVVYYNPQYTNIVVVNPVVLHPKKHHCPKLMGCQGTFRPNFEDRRYIHPSVFNGGSRQYVRPEVTGSGRKASR